MVRLENISLGYGNKVIIQSCSFNFNSKGLYLILGNNGAGKTTLLRAIAGLISPNQGSILLNNKPLVSQSLMQKSSSIFFADHPFPIPDFMTTSAYLGLGLMHSETNLILAINAMNIAPLSNEYLSKLSRGQQQKAMLAKMFYAQNPINLLDEPTNYLDYPSVQHFWAAISNYSQDKLVIATIHHPEEAVKLDAEILVVNNKSLISLGVKPELEKLIGFLKV